MLKNTYTPQLIYFQLYSNKKSQFQILLILCFKCQFNSFEYSIVSFYSVRPFHFMFIWICKNQHEIQRKNELISMLSLCLYQSVHLNIFDLSPSANVILLYIRFNVTSNIHKVQLLYTFNLLSSYHCFNVT